MSIRPPASSYADTIPAVNGGSRPTALRPLPYPYRAMLAICSDLDETPDREVYLESLRFLNTTEGTAMGQGVGLEIGNTIYFDMPADQFAYWNTDDAGRAMVHTLVRSGHIDCLHSYGDLATTRRDAGRALDALDRHGCQLKVWIDHAIAVTNFGADIMRGSGDVPGAAAYHADLTCDAGIEFVWRGRVTSVVGQNTSRSLRGIWTAARPVAAARTLAKEATKSAMGSFGSEKYRMHRPNRVLQPATLRDGRAVQEFIRCNPHPDGVNRGETAYGFASVVSAAMLDRLVARGGISVLYTHLGKIRDPRRPFDEEACAAFRRLAAEYISGRILVATTRRLLQYCELTAGVRLSEVHQDGMTLVHATMPRRPSDPAGWEGLTIYVDDPSRTALTVNGTLVPVRQNPPDEAGRPSLSVSWSRLDFPDVG